MIRMQTKGLVAMLADLVHTAADPKDADATAGVLLHTARGHVGGEPGLADLLVGTSTTGAVAGHTWTMCGGQCPPMLWPIADVRAVLAAFKPLVKIKEHTVEIDRAGELVTVREDASDLFEGGLAGRLSVSFAVGEIDDWPVKTVMRELAEVRVRADDALGADSPRTITNAYTEAPFLKVASRRGEQLHRWRWHPRLPIHIEIGTDYRGLLFTVRPGDGDGNPSAPTGDVHPLVLDGEGSA